MVSEVEIKELKRTIRLVARNLGTHHITGPEEYFENSIRIWATPSVLGDAREIWSKIKDNLAWQGRSPLALRE